MQWCRAILRERCRGLCNGARHSCSLPCRHCGQACCENSSFACRNQTSQQPPLCAGSGRFLSLWTSLIPGVQVLVVKMSPSAGAKSASIPPSLSGGLPGGGGSAETFVKRLKKDLGLRQGVAHVLQEQFLVGSGDEQVSQWLRDEGCMSTLDQVREPPCSREGGTSGQAHKTYYRGS